jgi:hypothetical protein
LRSYAEPSPAIGCRGEAAGFAIGVCPLQGLRLTADITEVKRFALFVLLIASATGCDENHQRVQAATLTVITEPANLSASPECQALWATLAEAGMKMDQFSSDWNWLVVKNAHALIDGGCVRHRSGE